MKTRIDVDPASDREMQTLVLEILQLTAEQQKLAAKQDKEVAAIKAEYEPYFTRLETSVELRMAKAMAWANAHPELFTKTKSVQMANGIVGFRTSPPALTLLSRDWSWDDVVLALKEHNFKAYIRTKEEVNKESIMQDRETIGAAKLKEMGLRVRQKEKFYVDPELTDVERVQTIKTEEAA